jgi:hypothetical protein
VEADDDVNGQSTGLYPQCSTCKDPHLLVGMPVGRRGGFWRIWPRDSALDAD